jgi:hypothetical protein
MRGLDPRMHVFFQTRMPGVRPGMTTLRHLQRPFGRFFFQEASMALPTQRPVYDRSYVIYAASLAAAASPSVPVVGRGRVIDIRFVPLVSPTTTNTVVTPKVNATQMTLNGAGTTLTIPAGAAAGALAGAQQPNGANIVDIGDVIALVSDGGAANASSVPGYFTIVVRETSQ